MKKLKGLLILSAIVIVVAIQGNTQNVEASSNNIKVKDFIEYIVDQMGWEVDKTSEQPYIDVAIEKGILETSDFKDYKAYLTRVDAAVIANRLDEYINQKYGYSKEAYRYLRECYLYKGRLYYIVKGSMYPNSEIAQKYGSDSTSRDIMNPILEKEFANDDWIRKGLRTRFEHIYDDIIETRILIGLRPDTDNKEDIDPFSKDSEIIRAWNTIKEEDRKVSIVLEQRISDIKYILKNKQEAVASIIAKGIIKGYSNGMYVQSREFRGRDKITDKGAKDVIQKVINPELRAQISPDGQLIRTSNLPENANDYNYILECFPNDYYEMAKRDTKTSSSRMDYDYLNEKYFDRHIARASDKYEIYDLALSKVKTHLQCIFNIDYRTSHKDWKEELASTYGIIDDNTNKEIEEYIDTVKKNRLLVECEQISFDAGTLYESEEGLYLRAYVKYKITTDNSNVKQGKLLYGSYIELTGAEHGKWTYGYYDIPLNYLKKY